MTEPASSEAAPLAFDFIPNHIQLLVRHTQALSADHFGALTQALTTQLGRHVRQRGEALTFNTNRQPAFSILPLEVETGSTLQTVIDALNRLTGESLTGLLQNSAFPTQAWQGQTQPLVAEPNWFTMSSNHGQGTGGTGSWPTPGDPNAPDPSQAAPLIQGSSKEPVTLVMLDTHLTSAGQAHIPSHLLNRLTFQMPMPASVHLDIAGHHVNGHQYLLTSHGVFGAYQAIRLIDKLAAANPNTVDPNQIHITIYEALNHFGVGSVAWICQILHTLSQQLAATPQRIVINLSLVLHAPAGGATALQAICDMLESQGAAIVAAAGNEAQRSYNAGLPRPEPMQPAAFGSVIGVSALAIDSSGGLNSAPYSNLSDGLTSTPPQRAGFAAIGGGVTAFNNATQVYEASTPEVNGPFVDVFPGGQANSKHWAFWSGTSFAAPRLSALAAVLLSTGAHALNASLRQVIEAEILQHYTSGLTAHHEPKMEA